MPLLDNLKIKIPEFQAFDFYQFDLNEQVEIVSNNVIFLCYNYNSQNTVETSTIKISYNGILLRTI